MAVPHLPLAKLPAIPCKLVLKANMARTHVEIDRACDLEQMMRDHALARQLGKSDAQAPSAFECESCGEAIPEARRIAAMGCRYCIDCQQEYESHGQTRFA